MGADHDPIRLRVYAKEGRPWDVSINGGERSYSSTAVSHSLLTDGTISRGVRWFPDTRRTYRHGKGVGGWLYLGSASSLGSAEHFAEPNTCT